MIDFEAIYNDNKSYIHSVVSRYVRNPAEAEEVTQEAFLKAWRARESFRGESAVRTWLHRIAVNTAKNYLVAQSRRPRYQDTEEDGEIIISDFDSPDSELERDQRLDAISDAVDNMPEELGLSILYRHVDGLTYEEISEAMNANIGTVRSRLHRARQLLSDKTSIVTI
ncbi:sigma-70 family RNA polymerase sigma factor [Aquisalimonas lutea]|uniref:sigma-70 family RNA polymerase sigma factor n=1 Tax=Aquisalimonas lutea TaxID=1327750 RepID=UPI0025B2E773|nr:sigma-70 family RNA polymerase sigma factor [Aquisalimonas lutea]MDN3518068.1 sigma-70 family RNA polymerase sigma factor [Aquisalimonas lutea]